ncbi:MAG: bifunctional riboflavin kinase/FAD synthetase [Pseudomonadota bacterium]
MTRLRDAAPFQAATLETLPGNLKGGTVAIGNFDGVHLGHQKVLEEAMAIGRPAVALTFEPHPRTFFGADPPVYRLTPPNARARVMAAMGLDGLVVAPFDRALASLSADAFVRDVLLDRLKVKAVVVGGDFHYGARRSGTAQTLAEAAATYGFSTTAVDGVGDDHGPISSTRIRTLLSDGDVAGAAECLGYRHQIVEEVIHGEKRGRTMGYPTANQSLPANCRLRHGIYAVRAHTGDQWRDGVASFGRRPTFDNGRPLLETFIFDYAGDLYGQVLPITLCAYLRPEMAFSSMDALVEQMDADSANAKAALSALTPLSPLDEALNF